MWLFPCLTIVTIAAIVAVLVLMGSDDDTRRSCCSACCPWRSCSCSSSSPSGGAAPSQDSAPPPQTGGTRVLVLANETVGATNCSTSCGRSTPTGKAEYFVCVPANPVDTGQAEHTGAVWVWEETAKAAQARLDSTLEILRAADLHADGELGDHRPLQALATAVQEFKPDRIVISTHPEVHSAWLRHDVVDRARETYPNLPVTHVVVEHAEVPA